MPQFVSSWWRREEFEQFAIERLPPCGAAVERDVRQQLASGQLHAAGAANVTAIR
jgi:hypothetical protein